MLRWAINSDSSRHKCFWHDSTFDVINFDNKFRNSITNRTTMKLNLWFKMLRDDKFKSSMMRFVVNVYCNTKFFFVFWFNRYAELSITKWRITKFTICWIEHNKMKSMLQNIRVEKKFNLTWFVIIMKINFCVLIIVYTISNQWSAKMLNFSHKEGAVKIFHEYYRKFDKFERNYINLIENTQHHHSKSWWCFLFNRVSNITISQCHFHIYDHLDIKKLIQHLS